uniref:EF-hand domain-containing protein n=1 Tax=Pyrodinium bahamense TaxID=73915 RepID=A0A7S0B6H4_9DINO|mmetsp:Transcript_52247/g.144665  ORF Transcript_52247/g.144665 Transcript_52247/m.144665 type:complete len:257 (+) Transcript_52247:178-948(+)
MGAPRPLGALLLLPLALRGRPARGQTVERVMSSGQMRGIHAVLDADGDGQASLAESTAYVERQRMAVGLKQAASIMEVMDTDRDGRLSFAEFEHDLEHWKHSDEAKAELKDEFASFDSDKDAILDSTEVVAFLSFVFRFRKHDADGDGSLSVKEWLKGVPKASPMNDEKATKKEGKAIFRKLDMDGNHKLSAAEFFAYDSGTFAAKEALRKLYEVADTDTNTHLSVDELVKVRESPKFHNTNAYYHLKSWISFEEL